MTSRIASYAMFVVDAMLYVILTCTNLHQKDMVAWANQIRLRLQIANQVSDSCTNVAMYEIMR